MKPIYKIVIVIGIVLYVSAIAMLFKEQMRTTEYCGKVTSIYRTDAGYKVSPQAHVIFYSDSLKRKIDVKVSNNTYANTQVGQPICFKLSKQDIKE